MNNKKTAGMRNLQKGLVWLLAATMLITMLPLAGLAAGHLSGAAAGQNPGNAPAFLSAYTAHAESFPTSGYAGDNAKWSYNKKTKELTISGSGSMWSWQDPFDDASEEIAPWLYYCDEIKTITIQSGVNYLGNYTFAACEEATKVSIPNSVTGIGEGAFFDCCSLTVISLPGNLTGLGQYSFSYCDSLKTVTVPEKIWDLNSAFVDCAGLESIKIASGNTAFKDIDGVVFSKDGKRLVSYPSGKKDHVYYVPDGVTKIWNDAFLYNSNIRAIVFPDGMTEFSNYSVQYNEKLFRVYLPVSIKEINWIAFTDCPALTDVYYGGTQEQKAQIEIAEDNKPISNAEWHYNSSPEDMLFALFEDVPKESWFYEHVIWAAAKNITTGTSDITFSPNDPCVRAQMVTFLWRTAGEPEPTSMEMKFTDVQKDAYYAKAVAWAVENNITQGTSETTFSPNGKLERGQTVTFLYRWANPGWDEETNDPSGEPEVTNPFDDITGDEYYAKAVFWAVKNNITQGMTPTTFAPKTTCNRAQIVTFLHRAVGGEPDKAA